MMSQIFICSTPYHVLLAHLSVECLSRHENITDVNRIIILTETAIIKDIQEIVDRQTWKQILFLPYQNVTKLYKTKQYIDNWIKMTGLNRLSGKKTIFINDDKRWRNQLLLTGIMPDNISLIEDGMGAYIKNPHPLKEKIYRGLLLRIIFGNRLINTGAISSISADHFFAFRNNAFPWFGTDRKLHILDYKHSQYIKKISQKLSFNKQKEEIISADLIILTTPLIEDRILSENDELNAWRKLSRLLAHPKIIAIKAHPRENEQLFQKRLSRVREIFMNSKTFKIDNILPAEFLFSDNDIRAKIFSPNSTTLANLRSIRPDLKIYHGCDLFFSHHKKNSSMRRLAKYFNQMGVASLSQH